MDGWELRETRLTSGLTLREVARAAGTSEPNVSAYERGEKVPNARTLGRVRASIAAGANSPVHARNLITAPAAAASIRGGLRHGWSTADLLRIVREMRSHLAHVTAEVDLAVFLAEPSTTGDQRWDAMLAANVEDLALGRGITPPAWTAGHALPTFWFVGSSPSLRAFAFARSPMSMQVRGVMVDPTDLEAV